MIRPPVNLSPVVGVAAWEGLVETDIWFGPLFSNIRITKTDTPVHLRSHVPFIQVQPLPQVAYREETLGSVEYKDMSSLAPEDWDKLAKVLQPEPPETDRLGNYAVQVRKRRLCPMEPLTGVGTFRE